MIQGGRMAPETVAKIKATMREVMADPEVLARVSAGVKQAWDGGARRRAYEAKLDHARAAEREENERRVQAEKARRAEIVEAARQAAADGLSARQAAARVNAQFHAQLSRNALIGMAYRHGFQFPGGKISDLPRVARAPAKRMGKGVLHQQRACDHPASVRGATRRGSGSLFPVFTEPVKPRKVTPVIPAAYVPNPQPVPLWELAGNGCRYPVAREDETHLFCGLRVAALCEVGETQKATCPHYCAHHVGLAFRAARRAA